jgi:aminoglycoside phosphotransferase (APT) family kinase protein
VIDFDRLAAWMDDNGLPGKGEPIDHTFLSGGSQNEIYEIRRGDERCVIRIPPPTAPANRDEGILREWRIIEALDGTDVPHTPAVAMCTDASVLGRNFYLMGLVDGWSPMDHRTAWPPPFDTDLEARAGLAYQLVEGIACCRTSTGGPRASRTSAARTASTSARSTAGPRSSSGSRAASSPGST